MKSLFASARSSSVCALLVVLWWPIAALGEFYVSVMEPVAGLPGIQVNIFGSGFDTAAGPITVRIGDTVVAAEVVASDTVGFTIPAGSESGTVEMSDGSQTSVVPLPFTVMREISGTLELPPVLAGSGWFVASSETLVDITGQGSFLISVPQDYPTMIWAVRNSNEPSFMTLVRPEDTRVNINGVSTAASMVYLVPPLASQDPQIAASRWESILAHPRLGGMAALIMDAAAGGRDYLNDRRGDSIRLEILGDVLAGNPQVLAARFRDDTPPGSKLFELLPEPASGPLAFEKVMEGKMERERAQQRFLFTYDPKREPSLDYVIDIYQLDPAQFESGFSSIAALDGESTYDFLDEHPVAQGFVRAKLAGRKLDYFGFLYDTLVGALTRPLDDRFKPNQFIFHESMQGVFAAHAYSGNIWYGLDRSLLGQANLLDEIDPNNQWAWTLGSNVALASLDLAGLFVNVKKLTGLDDSGYLDAMIKSAVKALLVYRSQGDVTSDQVYDLVKTMAGSIIKLFILAKGEEDGSIARKVASLTFRITGTMADAINIFKKIGTGINIAERTFNIVSPKNLAVERTVFVLNDPFNPVITGIEPRSGREGTEVFISGANLFEFPQFGEESQFPAVEFCTFLGTSVDPANAPANARLAAEVISARPNSLTVKVPSGWTGAFGSVREAFICVTRASTENTGDSRALNEEGKFEFLPPPRILGVEPGQIIAKSHFLIRTENFTQECEVLIDGFFQLTPLRFDRDKVLVAFPDPAITGERKLTIKCGEDVSNEFDINIGIPSFDPPEGSGGVGITVTKMDMSNSPDGEISLLEALLIANGGLGRTIEIHDPCEGITERDEPGYCGGPQQRETDFVSGDNEFGQGGGPGRVDRIEVDIDFRNQVFAIGQPLPPITTLDQVNFNDVTLTGAGASGGGAALTLDFAPGARVSNLVLKNSPGVGILIANQSSGVNLDDITIDGSGGAGIIISNESNFCRLTDLAIDNAGGVGLHIEGFCKFNEIFRTVVNSPDGHGVHLENSCELNSFSDVTIQGAGGDGFRIEAGSHNNKLEKIGIATSTGAGMRISGSHFNRMFSAPGGLGDAHALYHPKSNILDGKNWGIVVDGGSQFNVLGFQVVGQNASGGILVRGQGTAFNVFGKPYKRSPQFGLAGEDGVIYAMVADNRGSGIRIADGASNNSLVCLNVAGNAGDGVEINGEGTDGNMLQTILTGFRFFIKDSDPQMAPNEGDGISITGGAQRNHITRWSEAKRLFSFASDPFRTSLLLDGENGILIEGEGSSGNKIDSTTVGSNQDTRLFWTGQTPFTFHPPGKNGVAITGGAARNEVGSLDLFDDVHIEACPESAILIEGEGSDANLVAGCFIGDPEVFFDFNAAPDARSTFGITLRNGPKDNIIGVPGPMRGVTSLGFGGRVDSVNSIRHCREAGLVVDDCGGFLDADGLRNQPNRFRNNSISDCPVGLLIQNGAAVNDFGGPLHGPRGFVQIDQTYTVHENFIRRFTMAGIRVHNNVIPGEPFRNIFLNTSITSGIANDAAPNLLDGPPGGVGILIDGTSEGNVIGEALDDALNSVLFSPMGVYLNEVANNQVRGWEFFGDDFGFINEPLLAGAVLRNSFNNQIGGDTWGGRNLIHFWRSLNTDDGHGVMILGGGENRIVNNEIRSNKKSGLLVADSVGNVIGGRRGTANIIVENMEHGVVVRGAAASLNAIQGNFIGVERNNVSAANEGDGIRIENGAGNNRVGGAARVISRGALFAPPAGNDIAFNNGAGVRVASAGSVGNSILNNSIYANASGGIKNEGGGNEEIRPPLRLSFGGGRITGSVAEIGRTPAGSIIQVFSDSGSQGEVLIGEGTVKPGGSWFINGLLPMPFRNLSATVTSGATGSTSEFGFVDVLPIGFTIGRTGGGVPTQRAAVLNQGIISVLPLTAEAVGNPVVLNSLTIKAAGTLVDDRDVTAVRLYFDGDRDAKVSPSDFILGESSGGFQADDGTALIRTAGLTISPDTPQTWIVVYETSPNISEGTSFSAEITSAAAVNATFQFPIGLNATAQAVYPVRSDEYVVGQPQESTFDSWKDRHFPDALDDPEISGPDADPDGDDIPNLIEFASGKDPRSADAESPIRYALENDTFILEFVRDPAATGVEILGEASRNLVGWISGEPLLAPAPEVRATGDGTEIMSFRTAQNIGEVGHMFLRLVVRLLPGAP